MDTTHGIIEFTLRPGTSRAVQVRLRHRAGRWLALVGGPASNAAIGGSAREALTAALQPLGVPAVRVLLADLGLIEPSLAVLAAESEGRSA